MERKVERVLKSQPTIEGAGVRLKRVFGNYEAPDMDPFLLLDHFGSDNPADYVKGFPWHPHRGIETVTYMWNGEVEHGDSIGNNGVIKSGDVQWMTAGSGIIHQEMPRKFDGLMRGFQLWVNLPAKKKMMPPKYRGIEKQEIPLIHKDGLEIKVLSGKFEGVDGPVRDLTVEVEYLDVKLAAGKTFGHSTPEDHKVFAYIIDGSIEVQDETIEQLHCAVFGKGDKVRIGSEEGAHFLFTMGQPVNEPIAWGGPIVMNTQEELAKAFEELDKGTFIKTSKTQKAKKTVRG
jgi:redox-sensitive bicupin YhaK (pirin superfamily)